MNRIAAKQRGLTGSGFAALIVAIILVVLLLLKLFPVYMENFNVSSSLKSLSGESGITEMKKADIRKLLMKRFSINEVNNVRNEHITIKKEKGSMTVSVVYEVRKPLVGNIDIVLYFNEQLKI